MPCAVPAHHGRAYPRYEHDADIDYCEPYRATQNAGSKMAAIMPDVQKKQEDGMQSPTPWIGGNLVSMYHQLAIFTRPTRRRRRQKRRAIWRASGFELNADVYMHRQALLASLPMT